MLEMATNSIYFSGEEGRRSVAGGGKMAPFPHCGGAHPYLPGAAHPLEEGGSVEETLLPVGVGLGDPACAYAEGEDVLSSSPMVHVGLGGRDFRAVSHAGGCSTVFLPFVPVREFCVTVQKTEASERCKLHGVYVLKASWDSLILSEPPSSHPLYTWPYRLLRRYGRDKVGALLQTGVCVWGGVGWLPRELGLLGARRVGETPCLPACLRELRRWFGLQAQGPLAEASMPPR